MNTTTYYRQLADYTRALRTYINLATGVPLNRIVFSPPDISKRKLKEKLAETNDPAVNTLEIDNYISFYFPFSVPGVAFERTSVMQSFFGAIAGYKGIQAWADNFDLPVQIDIWAGPDQNGKEFFFNTRMNLEWYMQRHQGVHVDFRDFKEWSVLHPDDTFDVRDYYEIVKGEVTDNSAVEKLFTEGSLYRSTTEFMWMISLYKLPATEVTIGRIIHIIYEYQNDVTGVFEVEWEITSTTSTTTTTVI